MMTYFIRDVNKRGASKIGAVFLFCGALACGSDSAAPKQAQDAGHHFWDLSLNYRSITLSTFAPHDTVRIVATPLDAFGDPLVGALRDSAVTKFVASDPTDTSFVLDSLTGQFQALYAENGIVVRVRTTVGGLTRTDSVLVNITETQNPPVFSRMTLQTVPSDTFYQGSFNPTPVIVAQALDADGNPMEEVTFAFRSSNPFLFKVDPNGGIVRRDALLLSHGRAMAYAFATAYGVTHVDSVPITVTLPYLAIVHIRSYIPKGSLTPVGYFDLPVDSVAVGGIVAWQFDGLTDSIDVKFDDPSQVVAIPPTSPFSVFTGQCDPNGQGNIPMWAPDTTKPCGNNLRYRYFPAPGSYHFHSERYGKSGTIVVE